MKHSLFVPIVLISVLILSNNSTATLVPMPGEEEYLAVAEIMPEPIGGLTYINTKITYPDFAKRAGVEGKIYVLAFIDESGDVNDVKLIKGIGMGCDEEVMKAVKATKSKPGYNSGNPVKTKFTLAFSFKLTK